MPDAGRPARSGSASTPGSSPTRRSAAGTATRSTSWPSCPRWASSWSSIPTARSTTSTSTASRAGSYTARVREGLRLPIWEHRWLPRQCKADGVDLLHSPFNYGLPWSTPCPRVLTLHDAIDFIYYRRRARPPRAALARRPADRPRPRARPARAHRVITVSEHARGDIVSYLKVPRPQGLRDLRGGRPALPSRRSPPRPASAPARGIDLPAALRLLRRRLGGPEERPLPRPRPRRRGAGGRRRSSWPGAVASSGRRSRTWPSELGLGDRLHLLDWVEEEDLPALYAEALAFAYPSEYEGFGLQLCESMAVGCPTLAARATCLPEVLGDGGATFALDDPAELAGLLRRVATDDAFRADLSARARARSSAFSWRRTAEGTVAVYRELLGHRGPAVSVEDRIRYTRPGRDVCLEIADITRLDDPTHHPGSRRRPLPFGPSRLISGGRCPVRSSVSPYLLVSTEIARPRCARPAGVDDPGRAAVRSSGSDPGDFEMSAGAQSRRGRP